VGGGQGGRGVGGVALPPFFLNFFTEQGSGEITPHI